MYCFVILLLFNKMQMSVRRFSAIPHLRAEKENARQRIRLGSRTPMHIWFIFVFLYNFHAVMVPLRSKQAVKFITPVGARGF